MGIVVYVRETVTFDDSLQGRLDHFVQARNLTPQDTLVVAARKMVGPPAGATWSFRSTAAPPSTPARMVFLTSEYAGAGRLDFGGADGAAAAGRSAHFFVERVEGRLSLSSAGGVGAVGQRGQPGTNLTWSQGDWDRESRHYLPKITWPTPGGPGATGGTGGPGGELHVVWVTGPAAPEAAAPGGRGGAGGPGGTGGRGGHYPLGFIGSGRWGSRADAPVGSQGSTGPTGQPAAVSVQRVSREQLFGTVRSEFPTILPEVAAHWSRAADYWFRQIKGAPTEGEADSILALTGLALDVAPDPAALRTRELLLNGCNALGLPRYMDLVPDFEHYNDRLQVKLDQVSDMYAFAETVLGEMNVGLFTLAEMNSHTATVEDRVQDLTNELSAAAETLAEEKLNLKYATDRWHAINREIARRREELENAEFDWDGIVALGIFTLAGLVISIATEGVATPWVKVVLSNLPGVLAIGGADFADSPKEEALLRAALTAGAKVKGNAMGAKDLAKEQDDQGRLELSALVRETGSLVIDLIKIGEDVAKADGDAKLKTLVQEQVVRLHELAVAEHQVAVATRAVAALKDRRDSATRELHRYRQLFEQAKNDVTVLKKTVLGLLATLDPCVDLLLTNQFKAARALEIYALKDTSQSQRLSYGRVHPDDEADLVDDLITPTAFRVRLSESTSSTLDLLGMDGEFDRFMERDWASSWRYIVWQSTDELSSFKARCSLTVSLPVEALPLREYAARALGVSLYLDGVTAATPSFEAEVTHHGVNRQRWLDEEHSTMTIEQAGLRPRRQNVDVVPPSGEEAWLVGYIQAAPGQRLRGFWGRGIATTWTVSIDPQEIADNGVDLTELRKITLGIRYDHLTR